MTFEVQSRGILRFGVFEVDPRSGELRKQGVRTKLQDQPFQVLRLLLQRPRELVTRDELRSQIWPADTFVDFDNSLNAAINKLREALGDSADSPRFIETLPRRGYRFIAPVTGVDGTTRRTETSVTTRSRKIITTAATVMLAVGIAGGLLWRVRQARRLTGKDTIVLADFTNTAGDPVFDGTLRQGLSVELEQSPFLSIISDQQIQQTLKMMGHKPDAKLTPEIARELCQRTGSAVVLNGSIAQIGVPYLITVKAVNCSNGESLASTEAQAGDKSRVLDALGKTAVEIRRKLGESLSTVKKFDTPLAQATTPSLEALKAYSLGVNTVLQTGDLPGAVPFFQRATMLDPNFAVAYDALGTTYLILGQVSAAAESSRKAYALRDHATDREKSSIEGGYYRSVTGDLEKERQVLELWAQMYPRDARPRWVLSATYLVLGRCEKALEEAREAFGLNPAGAVGYAGLVGYYISLNRFQEARATAEEAQAKKFDSPILRAHLYSLAFLNNDNAGMAEQVSWSAGKPGVEDVLLAADADTAAYSGHLGKARELSRRAVASAEQAKDKETAASYESDAALREGLFGKSAEAQLRATAALALSKGRDAQYGAALALAHAGDVIRVRRLADDLAKRYPEDTLVRFSYLPTVRAQLAVSARDASKAIELVQAAMPYELGIASLLYPVYVRGEAYLAAHQGGEAAAEFQKILDHRGIVRNEPVGALAHLQIGRAYAMQGDTAKARAAYKDFLTLWKDADPDIPILKQAKAEYAKLQ